MKVHSSFIHNSPNLETAQECFGRQVVKQTTAHPCHGVPNNETKWTVDAQEILDLGGIVVPFM